MHPVLLKEEILESKEHGKKSTQLNDNEGNIELLLRVVIYKEAQKKRRKLKDGLLKG